MLFVTGIFLKVALVAFSKHITIFESFKISILSSVGNYFMPFRGGTGIRAVYFKEKLKISYSYSISSLSGSYVLIFFTNSVIALLSLTIIHIRTNVYSISLYIFFLVIFIITLLLFLYKFPEEIFRKKGKSKVLGKLSSIINNVVKGWNFIICNKRILLKLLLLTILNFFIVSLITYLEFKTIKVSIPTMNLLLYVCLSSSSLLISLTPGSIGIKESVLLVFASIIGITNNHVLQIALIDRGVLFFVLLILYCLTKIITKSNQERNSN